MSPPRRNRPAARSADHHAEDLDAVALERAAASMAAAVAAASAATATFAGDPVAAGRWATQSVDAGRAALRDLEPTIRAATAAAERRAHSTMVDQVAHLVAQVAETGTTATFSTTGTPFVLPPSVEAALLDAARRSVELLTGELAATSFRVDLRYGPSRLEVSIVGRGCHHAPLTTFAAMDAAGGGLLAALEGGGAVGAVGCSLGPAEVVIDLSVSSALR